MKCLATGIVLAMGSCSLIALDYEKDIMPIFVKKCADCHSDESGKAKGGLKLDNPKHLLGRLEKNNLVVPGDWDASYLFITLFRPEGHEDAMPPEGKGERLTPEEVTLVQRWITEGAPILGVRGERGSMPTESEAGFVTKKESDPAKRPAGPAEWTNRAGKTITATLVRVEGEVALLRLENGVVYRVPVASLSEDSQGQLRGELE